MRLKLKRDQAEFLDDFYLELHTNKTLLLSGMTPKKTQLLERVKTQIKLNRDRWVPTQAREGGVITMWTMSTRVLGH